MAESDKSRSLRDLHFYVFLDLNVNVARSGKRGRLSLALIDLSSPG